MFERLKRLYTENRIDAAAVERAVAMGWITEDQGKEITGGLEDNTNKETEA